jgi:hypothetical protein
MGGFFHHITFTFAFILLTSFGKNKGYNHPLYVAVAEINYNNSDKFATMVCKTFSDDLELALQKQYHKKGNFDTPENIQKLSSEMEGYIKSHLQLRINNKPTNFVFTSTKKDGNTIWNYFRINNINEIEKIEVTDTIFYEVYDSQVQIVYVTVNGNRKSNRVVNPESKLAFDF